MCVWVFMYVFWSLYCDGGDKIKKLFKSYILGDNKYYRKSKVGNGVFGWEVIFFEGG